MSSQYKIDILRQQLEDAKASELAAFAEFRRFDTGHYKAAWHRAFVKYNSWQSNSRQR